MVSNLLNLKKEEKMRVKELIKLLRKCDKRILVSVNEQYDFKIIKTIGVTLDGLQEEVEILLPNYTPLENHHSAEVTCE